MAFTSFDDFEKAFASSVEHGEVDCGKIGKLTIREPAAIVFEPIEAHRRILIERAELDHDCADDIKYLPAETLAKPREEWPKFSYLKFSPEDRAEWFKCCADIIVATVTNGNGELLFKGKEEHVMSWPGSLLTQVSDDIKAFVRGDDGGDQENGNPT
jgi:hypothetical protein